MGLFDSFSPEKWRQLAVALGFTPFQPFEPFAQTFCFRRMERVRGMHANASAPSYSQWLWGKWRGVDAVLIQYDTGSGSSSIAWTAAIVRIDPPLWLGLEVVPEDFMSRVFGGGDISVGHSSYDNALKINAFDHGRASMLLSPADAQGQEMLNKILGVFQAYVGRISDSHVEVKKSGVHTEPVKVAAMLDSAAELAAWLRFRQSTLPPSRSMEIQQYEWRRFAETNRFTFDGAQMVLSGVREGSQIDISVEMEGQRPYPVIFVRFPRPCPYDVFISRTDVPSFLQGILSQDIKVGNAMFDDAFKVQGNDEAGIRQWLGRPALLQALNDSLRFTNDLHINRLGLFMRFPSPVPTADNLEWLAAWSCVVSRELTGGSTTEQGPYR
jgi:hypothetical protein